MLGISKKLNYRYLMSVGTNVFFVSPSFFLDHNRIGKPRAHVATQLLMELNADVKGDYIEETCDQLLSNNPDFFCTFSVVIATGLTEK
jgi:amyloid beta precursor protein binding protein 1